MPYRQSSHSVLGDKCHLAEEAMEIIAIMAASAFKIGLPVPHAMPLTKPLSAVFTEFLAAT